MPTPPITSATTQTQAPSTQSAEHGRRPKIKPYPHGCPIPSSPHLAGRLRLPAARPHQTLDSHELSEEVEAGGRVHQTVAEHPLGEQLHDREARAQLRRRRVHAKGQPRFEELGDAVDDAVTSTTSSTLWPPVLLSSLRLVSASRNVGAYASMLEVSHPIASRSRATVFGAMRERLWKKVRRTAAADGA